MAENSAPERIWAYPSAMAGWAKAFCRLEKAEQIAVEYVRADLVATLTEQVERLTHERDQASAALRTVQNAAKTLASAQGGELEHLRQNATYDHRLRSEHESLLARDAQMTDALLAAEARAEAAEAELAKLREAEPVADIIEKIAAKLLGEVNAPEQAVYRVAREIASLIAPPASAPGAVKEAEAKPLAGLIRARLLGVEPDSQDLVLETAPKDGTRFP